MSKILKHVICNNKRIQIRYSIAKLNEKQESGEEWADKVNTNKKIKRKEVFWDIVMPRSMRFNDGPIGIAAIEFQNYPEIYWSFSVTDLFKRLWGWLKGFGRRTTQVSKVCQSPSDPGKCNPCDPGGAGQDPSEDNSSDPCKKKPIPIDKGEKLEDPCKKIPVKKEDPCVKKEKPPKEKEDPCKKKEKPPKEKEDPRKKEEKPSKEKEDPCKKEEKPSKEKEDPCKKEEKPSKEKEDPCKKEEKPPKKKEDPCKKEEKPPTKKEDSCKKEEKPPMKKEDPCMKEEKPPMKKEDPCMKEGKSPMKKEDACANMDGPLRVYYYDYRI